MKLRTLTLVVILAQQVIAQRALAQSAGKGTGCIVVSLSGGALILQQPGSNVAVSFPYTSTPVGTGVAIAKWFSGSLGGNFPHVPYAGDLLNCEVFSKNHTINGGLGLLHEIAENDGGILKAGYSRPVALHRDRLRLQFGADLEGVLGGDMELGWIDNRGQSIQLLGFTSPPQWTETYSDHSGKHTKTYDVDHLSIIYRRNGLLLEPKAVLVTSLKGLVLGIEIGWMFQLSQGCILKLQQQDGGDNDQNTIAKIHEPRNGSMSGLHVGLRAGMINRSHHIFSK